VKLEQTAQI